MKKQFHWWLGLIMGMLLLCTMATALYYLPPVHDRLAWRIAGIRTQIRYALNPPDQMVFVPQGHAAPTQESTILTPVSIETVTLPVLESTPTPIPTATQPGIGATPSPTPSPTPTLTPLPGRIVLPGIRHEYQSFNNCGPATLSMALSYWNWNGDQRNTKAVLRPHPDDYNVMPEEMAAFVEQETDLRAIMRAGGEIETIKRLVAAGFPVIAEKGQHPHDDWWMGHYVLVNGFDDERQVFITQDSYVMADYPVPYSDFSDRWWRDFNYIYLVIFPAEKEDLVLDLLGHHSDVDFNYRWALEVAEAEIPLLTGRDLFFAWYNKGSNLVAMEEYTAAAEAYDQAFAVYAQLNDADRPWRMIWYQIGPYPAYFYSGRYQDVINLANTALNVFSKGGLEESYYWRGLAKEALGDNPGGLADLKMAVSLNTNFTAAREALNNRGISEP